MRRLLILSTLAPLLVAAADLTPQQAARAFGSREMIQDIDISPDGGSVVYVTPGPGTMSVVVVTDLASGQPKPIMRSSGDPERLSWCNFVSNSRLICRAHALVPDAGQLIPFSRLFTMNTDGSDIKELGQRASFYDERIRQFDGAILDWLPGDGTAVLMSRDYVREVGRSDTRLVRRKDGIAVDRIDLKTLRVQPVEPPHRTASGFMSDGQGKIRMMWIPVTEGATGQLMGATQIYYRKAGSKKWEEFSTYDQKRGEGLLPVAIDASIDSAYVLKKLNGRDALYRVKLDGSMATELAYANDKVDVDNVERIGRGARVIGATFAEEQRRTVYFDPEFAKLSKGLAKAIPNLPLVDFQGSSWDNSKLLVFAGSDSDPGRYYVYDKAKRALNEIALVRPNLEHVKLASVRSITYPASDGTPVPAYLTLPPGSAGRKLPTIVLPHGGPSARDEWGFDWMAQYFAHRGYAVLQPNYRGSAGYGEAWMKENGFRSWQTSIGDVTAGAKWLVQQGIADTGKLAILGWSYGGYAALQAGATEPGLFKAIVAIAPVTDLDLLKTQAAGFSNAALVRDFIGSGPHVQEGSPLQNAERIQAPVLLFHGDRDLNVDVSHSVRMDKRLREIGKKSELTLFPKLEHDLGDSAARTGMLEKIGAFLGDTLK